MRSNARVGLAVAAVVFSLAAAWLSTSVAQSGKSYEIEAQVYTTPEYRTDAARAIDAYERAMQRYMDTTERHFIEVLDYTGAIAARLEAIDARLSKLDARLERIERHLGIVPPAPPAPDPNAPRPPVAAPPTVRPAPDLQ